MEHRWRTRGGSTIQIRTCLGCGNVFEFIRIQGVRGRGPGFCSDECRRQRHLAQARKKRATYWDAIPKTEQARRRRAALLARYNLTPERYIEMVADQGGICAVCGKAEAKHHSLLLKIDHDRSCCPGNESCGRCVRGLLCSNCNRALGLFGDDPKTLRAAIDYLERTRVLS